MKAYEYMWRMIRYRPVLYTANSILWIIIHISSILPGLIVQQFFNALPGAGHLNHWLWTLLMLLDELLENSDEMQRLWRGDGVD
jgi:ATP-binding cassette subfamily B protein